jgi:arginase family enzyme
MLQKSIRKIKVLGYPFAGGQGKTGVEKTPAWMASQSWFKNMRNVEFEMVPVSYQGNNLSVDDAHYD